MTKSQQQLDKEAKEQADQQAASPEAAALEAAAQHSEHVPGQSPVTTPPPEVFPPQVAPEQAVKAVQEGRKGTGLPSADEIRAMRQPDPVASADSWLNQTRVQLGDYLRERVQMLNDGTELEFAYPGSDANDVALWSQHYIKFQGELQDAGYNVFMVGQRGNPHLRIKLAAPRKIIAE